MLLLEYTFDTFKVSDVQKKEGVKWVAGKL